MRRALWLALVFTGVVASLARADQCAVLVSFDSPAASSQFRRDLITVGGRTAEIRYELRRVANATEVDVPCDSIESIKRLPYVAGVANEGPSLTRTHLPSPAKWSSSGTVVGVIGDGIDERTLGGRCVGPDCEIALRLKLIDYPAGPNTDSSKIAAFVDSVTRSDVTFVDCQLQTDSSSRAGDLLASLELLVDPNLDGDTSDHVDIAVISPWFAHRQTNAMLNALVMRAVDRAASLGVLFVVPTSGDVDSGWCRGSKSCTRVSGIASSSHVLAVGRSGPADYQFPIGPVIGSGLQKPDLMSRATDAAVAVGLVAGFCANLKSAHHDWSPELIRSALVSTAKRTNDDLALQGAGIPDEAAYMGTTILPQPGFVDFGYDGGLATIFTTSQRIKVTNAGGASEQITFAPQSAREGVAVSVSPTAMTLAAGETAALTATIRVDHTMLKASSAVERVGGAINIQRASGATHVSWQLTLGRHILVTPTMGSSVLVIGGKSGMMPMWYDSPQKRYDALTPMEDVVAISWTFRNRVTIKRVDETGSVSVSPDEAIHHVTLTSSSSGAQRTAVAAMQLAGGTTAGLTDFDDLWISDVPSDIVIVFAELEADPVLRRVVLSKHRFNGISSDLGLSKAATADFVMTPLEISISSAKGGVSFAPIAATSQGRSLKIPSDADGVWRGELWLDENASSDVPTQVRAEFKDANQYAWTYFTRRGSDVVVPVRSDVIRADDYVVHRGQTIRVTGLPLFRTHGTQVTQPALSSPAIWASSQIVAALYNFYQLSAAGSIQIPNSRFVLLDANRVVVDTRLASLFVRGSLSRGAYELSISGDPQPFAGKVTAKLDTERTDAQPPEMRSLRIIDSSGEIPATLAVNNSAIVVFSANDPTSPNNSYDALKPEATRVSIAWPGHDFQQVPVTFSPPVMTSASDWLNGLITFSADLRPFLPSTATSITLRIHIEDVAGNSADYDVDNAAAVTATIVPPHHRAVRR
jgi:hypothetical protein